MVKAETGGGGFNFSAKEQFLLDIALRPLYETATWVIFHPVANMVLGL